VLEEEAALLEGAEGSQATGSKRKEVTAGDEEEQWPSKKARGKQLGKYCRGAAVKMGGATLCERCVPHTNTNNPAIIPTYGGVLSAIEKALRGLVEEYRGAGKSLRDLM